MESDYSDDDSFDCPFYSGYPSYPRNPDYGPSYPCYQPNPNPPNNFPPPKITSQSKYINNTN